MRTSSEIEVLITGAGPAGLTLAIELARRGVRLRLIDKAAAPFTGSRGKGLQPRSLEVFEDLDVLDRMAARGGPYPASRIHRGDGHVDAPMMEGRPSTAAVPYGAPLMLPQNLTEQILRERLAELGVRPEFGCELRDFRQDRKGVAARLQVGRRSERIRACYLVGADGGSSFVRKRLGVGFPGETLPGRALVADVAVAGLSREAWHVWNAEDAGETLALCPLAGTGLFQLQAALAGEGDPDLSDRAVAELIAARTGRPDLAPQSVGWRSAFGLNVRVADRYRWGHVFLAGDAAHVHPPSGGQGLNTSIQDAYALGWRLAAALQGAPDGLLDTYEAERRPVALEVLALSRALLQAAREGQKARRGAETHELDLGYFDSPLAFERRGRSGRVRAGSRAPDAPCHGAGGRPTRLFEVFRGPRWTLLAYEPPSGDPATRPRRGLSVRRVGPAGDLRDTGGHIADAYDLDPGDRVLVRPDGYVGAVVSASGEEALEAYLDGVGLAVT
jgi:2-polyprenyl-6-methoxyphenol hydroxylase-like FAD-dependent oxidoreductase